MYVDELSLCLHSVNVHCRLSNVIVNYLLFADDAVVFAPSAKGLQQLLDTCSKFAESHRVVFSVDKSQCIIVKSKNHNMTRLFIRLFNSVGQLCPLLIVISILVTSSILA